MGGETIFSIFCIIISFHVHVVCVFRELKEFAEKLRAEFEQEKRRAVNVATRSLERDLGKHS